MDKLTAVSGILFLVADVFAIASLAHPEWIVSDVAGKLFSVVLVESALLRNGTHVANNTN